MKQQFLKNYLEQGQFPVVVKEKKKYLTYEGLQDRYVYILKEGIIKTSMITREGREFNLRYINNIEIVSILRDEYSQFTDAPFNIRVESKEAHLYQIDRVKFWQDVNQNLELQQYVHEYYRDYLLYSIKKMQQMLMNGKFGAVCTQLDELIELFGEHTADGILINFVITNDDLARFCGITSASSVNRMLQQLRDAGAIRFIGRKILVLNRDLILENKIE